VEIADSEEKAKETQLDTDGHSLILPLATANPEHRALKLCWGGSWQLQQMGTAAEHAIVQTDGERCSAPHVDRYFYFLNYQSLPMR
jgi:hypothetical protein